MLGLAKHLGKKKVDIRATLREAEIVTGHPGVRMEDSEPRDWGEPVPLGSSLQPDSAY